jgi:hypothetical protein
VSPLTKIFVVLLVILSIVSSAAFVTYVNVVEETRAAITANQTQLAARSQELENVRAALSAAQSAVEANFKAATDQIERMKQLRDEANRTVADRDAQLARANSQLALQSADLSRVTEALKSSESTTNQLTQAVTQLRQNNDQLVRQNADQSMTISDLTNRLEVTERERRFLAEQFTEARGQVDRLGRAVRDMGGDLTAILGGTATAGVGRGAPPINGVVRATRQIAGIPYATISVGSADNVVRGMKFNVVDRDTGTFLGTLTVDTVEPNESTGRLEGPSVAQVRPGVEVRTQL